MFTGIVATVGRIETVPPLDDNVDAGMHLSIDAGGLPLADMALGGSIATQGACMAVVTKVDSRFKVDVLRESLSKTVGLEGPGGVNPKKALRLANHIGGHLVSDHVDGLSTVTHFTPVSESHELRVRVSTKLDKYLACKSFVMVNGVSLTVNAVRDDADDCEFSISLIPRTVTATTLRYLKVGNQVGLKIDLIVRYVERMLTHAAISLPVGTRPPAAV